MEMTNKHEELNVSKDNWSHVVHGAGILRDILSFSSPAVQAGFEVAKHSTHAGFHIGRRVLSFTNETAQRVGFTSASLPLTVADAVVGGANEITEAILHLSSEVTCNSLALTDSLLQVSGIKTGTTLKLLEEYINASSGNQGVENSEALVGVLRLLTEISPRFCTQPLATIQCIERLSIIHLEQRTSRISLRPDPIALSPTLDLRQDLKRFLCFAVAAYGLPALKFLNILKRNPANATELLSPDYPIIAMTGVRDTDILLHAKRNALYKPHHFVAVDHLHHAVVVAIRGTMSFQDLIVDLVCEKEEIHGFSTSEKPAKGSVHRGFLKSAKCLISELHELITKTLLENPTYRLIITGHSLGGGIATLMALLWAPLPLFQEREIHAYAFGAPCSVCHKLSQSPFTLKHVTSIVVGDDIVSRLSLGSFKELQTSVISLDQEPIRLEPQVEACSTKLYCAGRTLLLESPEFNGIPQIIDPVEALDYIDLSHKPFSVHTPDMYVEAIKQAFPN